ncbi:hypothetical protein As57867_019989, partial [Aphanomyces stellatus]
MATEDESGLGSLGFFTGVSVDDKKYETLLEDLRAHDLLGPVDDGLDHVGYGGAAARPSLLLHDSLSAIFSGNVPKDKPTAPSQAPSAPKVKRAPPPGFGSAPAGNAPTQADLEWARSQQEFAMLREEFSKKVPGEAIGFNSAGLGLPKPYLYSEEDEDDDALLNNLKTLGLDEGEDDKRRSQAPQPNALPPPRLPGPPPGIGAHPPTSPPGMMPPPPGMHQHHPHHAPPPPGMP